MCGTTNISLWQSFERNHWKYYLRLEKDFLEIINFIEFVPENFSVYSIKLMQLLLTIGSETEAVMKEICQIKSKNKSSIANYAAIIINKYPTIKSQKICVFRNDLSFAPFCEWDLKCPSQSLPFWDAYNAVKHKRTENFPQASLEVTANGLAALFVLNMYRFNEIYLTTKSLQRNMPEEQSTLFYLDDWIERVRASCVTYHYRVFDDDTNDFVL